MIGIDIISIARMRGFVEKFGIKGLRRFLSDEEIVLCLIESINSHNDFIANHRTSARVDSKTTFDNFQNTALGGDSKSLHHIKILQALNITRVAGFWAAKEACSKALGVGIGRELGFLDIKIRKNTKKAPLVCLSDEKMAYFGVKQLSLSISHDGGFAIAAVICV